MRLNRFLASAGLGSRRSVEELIRAGDVSLNGRICTDLATDITERDYVKVRGRLVRPQKVVYALLYKPRGFICSRSDEEGRRTIFDLLPSDWPRLFHVGRLDKESEGLLIVTNDGELALRLTHPSFKVEKEYEVLLDRPFDWSLRPKLLKGFNIEGGWAKAEQVQRESPHRLQIVLRQGLKRQIRLMFNALDYEVKRLCRTRLGPLKLGALVPGKWRFLTTREIAQLRGEEPATPPTQPRPPARGTTGLR